MRQQTAKVDGVAGCSGTCVGGHLDARGLHRTGHRQPDGRGVTESMRFVVCEHEGRGEVAGDLQVRSFPKRANHKKFSHRRFRHFYIAPRKVHNVQLG
jgi:hypothetical protein